VAVADHARLPYELMLPAPAQGALAVQIRDDDAVLGDALRQVDHRPTRIAVDAERTLLRRIGGGCLAPLGALGEVVHDVLRLRAAFEDASGSLRRADASGRTIDADAVVAEVAARIVRE
jgi:hydroxymethylbilane synthase